MCLLSLTSTNNGRREVHLLHGGIGKVHGGLLIIPKVKREMNQVLSERGATSCLQCLASFFEMTFTNSFYFVAD